jgi:hypothetical protein
MGHVSQQHLQIRAPHLALRHLLSSKRIPVVDEFKKCSRCSFHGSLKNGFWKNQCDLDGGMGWTLFYLRFEADTSTGPRPFHVKF